MLSKPARAAFTATVLVGCLCASSALAATGAANTQVAGGIDAASIPGVVAFGTTPASTPETVSFILRERNAPQLAALAQSGSGDYLSVSQFASAFGATPVTVAQLESYLKSFGISTDGYADNIDVVANGTAGAFDKALGVTEQQWHAPAQHAGPGGMQIPAQTFHGVSGNPSLPGPLASQVTAILGLTDYSAYTSASAHVNSTVASKGRAQAAKDDSTNACLEASGFPDDCNLPSDYASMYGLDPVYREGATGSGQTLGIVTLAPVDDAVDTSTPSPEYFWSDVLGLKPSGRTVHYENIDGGPAPDPGNSIETDVDVEQSGAIAPGANIVVYQAPNDDSGFADGYFTAATQDVAGSVSASWGDSETYYESLAALGQETPGYFAAMDEAFMELDVQGQASFAASGDSGAYDASADVGSYNLSVDAPADSPYVTAAGGSTLPFTADLGASADGTSEVYLTVPAQRMWGWDYTWQPLASLLGITLKQSVETYGIGGDGGGFSQVEAEPSYQRGVSGTNSYAAVPYLTGTDYDTTNGLLLPEDFNVNPNPGLTFGRSGGRAVPDLATNADPNTGYEVYAPGALTEYGIGPLFDGLGGTSFAAPQLNGVTAVIDSLLHRRVGFWNPAIYRFATNYGSPFTPLGTPGTTNDNLYYSGTPGATFDAGAGLGLPNFAKLANDFASSR